MERKSLIDSLERVRAELQRTGSLQTEDREHLDRLVLDVESLINKEEAENSAEGPSVVNRLKESTRRFEVSHPELTGVMSSLVDSLSNLGF